MIVYFLSMCLSMEKGAAGVHRQGFPSLQKPHGRPVAHASPAAILDTCGSSSPGGRAPTEAKASAAFREDARICSTTCCWFASSAWGLVMP